jgi:hypothetical protein
MPLVDACKLYVGRYLLVVPYYGYGWTRPDLGGPAPEPPGSLGPEPYHLEVEEIIYCQDKVMGVAGTIAEPRHSNNGQWCACLLRNTDDSDFTVHPGHYMIWIALTRLPVHPVPYPQKALYQWVAFDRSSPCLCGYGAVAESVEWIRDLYDTTMATRRRKGG